MSLDGGQCLLPNRNEEPGSGTGRLSWTWTSRPITRLCEPMTQRDSGPTKTPPQERSAPNHGAAGSSTLRLSQKGSVHPAMRRVLRKPSLLDELELGAAPIPVPEPDCDQTGADSGKFPSDGGEVIAQLAQRIKRRRGRRQILVARAGRWRRSSPRHTRLAFLRLPGTRRFQCLGRLRRSRCRTQRAKPLPSRRDKARGFPAEYVFRS